jgi:hypothetical protein
LSSGSEGDAKAPLELLDESTEVQEGRLSKNLAINGNE